MSEWDELSHTEKVHRTRLRQIEDAQRAFSQRLYCIERNYQFDLEMAEKAEAIKEMLKPKLIKTPWGVLFA